MAYSNQFISLSFLFTLLGTDEIADTGLNFTTAPGWTGADAAVESITTPDLQDIYEAYATLWGGATELRWADYSELTAVKVAAVGTDGHYLGDPIMYEPTLKSKGTATQVLPQSSIVVSTNSGMVTGGGNRGRMFLPHSRLDINAGTPYIDNAVTALFAERARTFVNTVTAAMNASIAAIVFPAIMSQATPPTAKGITEVKVGNVNDTQRRRRNRLPETYRISELA